jgi:molecular chaperone DnaJ
VKIPAGTQNGQIFKLRGKGVVNVEGRGRGDLLARVIVEVPTRLNSEQRRKLEEFSALVGEDNCPLHKRFFDRAKDFFR